MRFTDDFVLFTLIPLLAALSNDAGADPALERQVERNTNAICDIYRLIGFEPDLNCPARTRRFVFVTSDLYFGDFGGVLEADAECNSAARSAGRPGIYRAWTSTSPETAPSSRFIKSDVRYVNTAGQTIADDWEDLVDGELQANIIYDEDGDEIPVGTGRVWTGSAGEFGVHINAPTCESWTSQDFAVQGNTGLAGRTNGSWANASPQPCNNAYRLYCFQQ